MSHAHEYCDHCGTQVLPNERMVMQESPVHLTSVNAGESATVCRNCWRAIRDFESAMVAAHFKLERAARGDA